MPAERLNILDIYQMLQRQQEQAFDDFVTARQLELQREEFEAQQQYREQVLANQLKQIGLDEEAALRAARQLELLETESLRQGQLFDERQAALGAIPGQLEEFVNPEMFRTGGFVPGEGIGDLMTNLFQYGDLDVDQLVRNFGAMQQGQLGMERALMLEQLKQQGKDQLLSMADPDYVENAIEMLTPLLGEIQANMFQGIDESLTPPEDVAQIQQAARIATMNQIRGMSRSSGNLEVDAQQVAALMGRMGSMGFLPEQVMDNLFVNWAASFGAEPDEGEPGEEDFVGPLPPSAGVDLLRERVSGGLAGEREQEIEAGLGSAPEYVQRKLDELLMGATRGGGSIPHFQERVLQGLEALRPELVGGFPEAGRGRLEALIGPMFEETARIAAEEPMTFYEKKRKRRKERAKGTHGRIR